jgi:hypothetical protein
VQEIAIAVERDEDFKKYRESAPIEEESAKKKPKKDDDPFDEMKS